VGLLSEDRKGEGLALALSVADNLMLSKQPRFVCPSQQCATAKNWIEQLGVRCRDPRQAVGELSGGNQQKVALARLLHHGVDVLLLDEPTRGIDVASKAQIYRLIDDLATQGKAVLLVSSYLPELFGVCDRIAVMCRGRLGEGRPVSELNEHQVMVEATGAEAA
jgi:ribose transport system ATP-binding protein